MYNIKTVFNLSKSNNHFHVLKDIWMLTVCLLYCILRHMLGHCIKPRKTTKSFQVKGKQHFLLFILKKL